MRKILKFFGTKAGVGVPLESDSTGVDVFAMDKVRSEHVWPKDIVEQSKAIGKVILSAMRRREAEVKLQDSYDEIKQLKDRLEAENVYLQQEIKLEHQYGEIIGQSNALRKVLSSAEKVAKTDSTVLITGETGVGKELLARAIHDLSNRKERVMLKVNCAALPSTLIESELFGREKGAYTGALTKQTGRFEVADNSTIFLDEISELSIELQAKLLRVLQEGQFERLGSTKTIQVDVRVIAATNQDIEKAVQDGHFRKDLYYRLNVFPIEVPPLSQRKEDIPLLIWTFVKEFSEKMGKRIESIPREAMEALQNYSWPGNVRQLRNVIEHSMILTKGTKLNIEMPKLSNANISRNKSLEDVERGHIVEVLEAANWRIRGKNGAAEILGLKPTTLEARMHKLDIRRK
jgi:transcriptional regulator with GAF, ATPase, and Fis domain